MRITFFISLLLSVALILPSPVTAQDAAERADPELPDIAPQEIEIRGRLEISFPALERQPLVGFNPPPAVPSVPAGHRPFIEEYKQDPDARRQELPGREGLPQIAQRPDPNIGEFEAQLGRYHSRIGRARFDLPLSQQQRLAFNVDYQGQDRFTPFQDTTFAPHDFFDAEINFSSSHGALTLGADISGHLDRYAMHQPLNFDFEDARYPLRENYGGQGSLWLRHHGSVPVSMQFFYGEHFFDAEPAAMRVTGTQERTFGGDAALDGRMAGHLTSVEMRGTVSEQIEADLSSSSLALLETTLSAQIIQSNSLNLTGGVYLATATDRQGEIAPDALDYFAAPVVRASWQPTLALSFYAQNTPSATANTWRALFSENPYLQMAPEATPSVTLVDAEAGVALFQGPFQINLHGGYSYSPRHRYFEHPDALQEFTSTLVAAYDRAATLRGGGDISLHVGENLHASVGGTYRDAQLLDHDVAVPYVAPLSGHAMLSTAFADQRALLQLTGRYESARPLSSGFQGTTNPYVALDVRGVYDFTPNVGMVVEAQNIGPRSVLQQWDGYPVPPFLVSTGLRVRL